MANLQDTHRCALFSNISLKIWEEIIHDHSVNVEPEEKGITKKIVSEFRHNYNIGVWANLAYREDIHGNDIDIFVETGVNRFIWFALQAKILKLNQRYDGMNKQTNGRYQWDMLLDLARDTGCVSYYLLYNGINKSKSSLVDCCGRKFDESQFGCSIVEINNIITICQKTSNKVRYADFHPLFSHPWRELVCCMKRRTSNTRFSLTQIKESLQYYQNDLNPQLLNSDTSQDQEKGNDIQIEKSNDTVGRTTAFKIVVRTTAAIAH